MTSFLLLTHLTELRTLQQSPRQRLQDSKPVAEVERAEPNLASIHALSLNVSNREKALLKKEISVKSCYSLTTLELFTIGSAAVVT